MLWNWNTIDSCFLAKSWHITSQGMFAGSCIGVVLLVMVLEMMRRLVKEYDRYLIRKHAASSTGASDDKAVGCNTVGFRPTLLEQAVRALLHMVQFAVAYFVMLSVTYISISGRRKAKGGEN